MLSSSNDVVKVKEASFGRILTINFIRQFTPKFQFLARNRKTYYSICPFVSSKKYRINITKDSIHAVHDHIKGC
jgi:excinuclease UvrABC nuclease subunit